VGTLFSSPLRNLTGGVIYMLVVMAAATAAYVAHGWPLGDAVYMVVLTVYTVGYQEVRPIDTPGLREVTIALIVLGCTGVIFLTGALVQAITATQFQQLLGLKRMQGQIDRLSDHIIVCGFGRLGTELARGLHAGGADFVVIDRNVERVSQARELGYLCVEAEATDEAGLRAAGVERARALATVLPDDAANVFITLSARALSRDLSIIARGELPSTEVKLLQAGANRVVLPTHIGAERISEIVLYPEAERILRGSPRKEEFARDLRGIGLEMEIMPVEEGSRCAGMTVAAIEQAAAGALLIVGLNRQDGESITRPDDSTLIRPGDGLVVLSRPGKGRTISGLFERRLQRSARG
jgi:voltage-gated potassium channel Kch